jgi:UDP-2,3-diacylglucosamine hydrolase
VAAYFASDVHLRLDCPERSRRFARFVSTLEPRSDTLTIIGDLCDFWFEARQCRMGPPRCDGLRALADFRTRGGAVTVLLGNHDGWLGPYYVALGLDLCDEPLQRVVHGIRVHLVHGHRIVGQRRWKAWMESQSFLRIFRALPDWVASLLGRLLEWNNEHNRLRVERRYFARYRDYASRRGGEADLVVVGHVHTPLDAAEMVPRLIVPGGWHVQSSYVRIDEQGAALCVASDDLLAVP